MNKRQQWTIFPGLTLAGCLVGAPACAAEWDAIVSTGLGYSDNVGRRPFAEQDDTIANAQVRFSIDENTPRLFADVVGDIGYYKYLDDTFDPEVMGNLAADVNVTLVEDYLRWRFTDNFGQVVSDPFIPATPANRENLNYFATGPEAHFQFARTLRFTVGAQYSRSDYEISQFDADGWLAHLALSHDFSEHSSLGLNARYMQVDYDDLPDDSYDQDEYFLRYDAQGAKTRLIADAGYAQIDQDSATETEDGPIFRLEVTRQVTARSVMVLDLGHEFTNSAIVYSQQQNGAPMDLENVGGRQTVDPFLNTRAALRWNFDATRGAYMLSGSYRDEDHEQRPDLDQKVTSFMGEVQRYATPTLHWSLRASFVGVNFDQPGADYDELDGTAQLTWRMSRNMNLSFSYQYSKRDSDLALASYTENRVWLSIGWQRGMPRNMTLNRFERSRRPAGGN